MKTTLKRILKYHLPFLQHLLIQNACPLMGRRRATKGPFKLRGALTRRTTSQNLPIACRCVMWRRRDCGIKAGKSANTLRRHL